jgi:ABC-type transport system involved in multi-copper enzyme maturation permease subunit
MTYYLAIVTVCALVFAACYVAARFLRAQVDRLLTGLFGPVLWAVTRNTIAQAVRIKAGFVIIAIYLIFVPSLPFLVEGDQTLHGLLRVVLTYAFIVASFMLSVLTLALATTTLWSEFSEKQIFVLQSKPVHRWQILLGKLLGILTVDLVLMLFMGIVTWSCVQVIVRQDKWTEGRNRMELEIAREQVLTTRRVLEPEPLDLEEGVRRSYKELLEKKPEALRGMSEDDALARLRKETTNKANQIPPRTGHVWRFTGLPKFPSGTNLTLQFKFSASMVEGAVDEPVRIRWLVGRPNDRIRSRPGEGIYKANEIHEIQVPASTIAEDRVLEVHLLNFDRFNRVLVLPKHSVMKCMVPVGGFAANLARGLALLFIQMLFLAILGLFCSTFLTFPVSPIVALCLLLLIYLAGTMHAEFEEQSTWKSEEAVAQESILTKFVKVVTMAVRKLLPTLDEFSPTERVSMGQEVSLLSILHAGLIVGLLHGGVLLYLGILIFRHREVALAVR